MMYQGENNMKKLMILGGSRYAIPVIKKAHELGVYVITCDYLPDNIAHKYSDEYYNVSIIDKEAVLEVAMNLKIDGITSFACDPGVITAAYVADKMGLPSCGSYESICILQNKAKFRLFLKEHGFNVPRAYSFKDNITAINCNKFDYPVIVKPVDSAGSKGVSRVDSKDQLEAAINHAFDYSITKEIIIEDFLEKDGFSSDTDCFSIEGDLKFVSFNSQRFDESSETPYVPAAYSWPSTMSHETEEYLKVEIQRLISLLKLKTSIYNIETRVAKNKKPYIMEMSPRGGGNRLAECLCYATGVDLIEGVVRAALGLPIENISQKPYQGFWAEVILHSNKTGTFKELWISDKITAFVFEKDLWVSKGDKIYSFDAANKAIGTLVLRFSEVADLERIMSNINCFVNVLVED